MTAGKKILYWTKKGTFDQLDFVIGKCTSNENNGTMRSVKAQR